MGRANLDQGAGARTWAIWRRLRSVLAEQFVVSPIRDEAELARFLGTRAAKIAQTGLFGYLRARMGTRATALFEDEAFVPVIERAQRAVFFASLEDLTVYALVHTLQNEQPAEDRLAAAGARLIAAAVVAAEAGEVPEGLALVVGKRVLRVGPGGVPDLGTSFAFSAQAVIDNAPVDEAFKNSDRSIVTGSMRYRWIDVKRQFERRLDRAALRRSLGL
ncbi:MAG: hypothetical protein AAF409_13650 [Pseudomonadota bacterium]